MCCPNIFGVRVPNNGAILTAAIGHQIVHVALPRHADERGVLEGFLKKIIIIIDTEAPEARSPDERHTRRRGGGGFRVSNGSHSSTLTNVQAGAAMRLGVVPSRSLRTTSPGRFYGSGVTGQIRREAPSAAPQPRSPQRTVKYHPTGFLSTPFIHLISAPC